MRKTDALNRSDRCAEVSVLDRLRNRRRATALEAPLVREYELIRPDGRWHAMRFPTRAVRLRSAATVVLVTVISSALWVVEALPQLPLLRLLSSWLGN